MKVAPLLRAGRAWSAGGGRPGAVPLMRQTLIHTGQHYDASMSEVFFEQLGLPKPDVNLGVGSGSQGHQTGQMLIALEDALIGDRPDMLLCVGDVNSTLAAALAAAKLHIPVAHVEAGLRSHDRRMPEEINRIVTDHLSDLLFTTSEGAAATLRHEGISDEQIHVVGNTMIDTLLQFRSRIDGSGPLSRYSLSEHEYCVVTLHRPSNVDSRASLEPIVDALCAASEVIPLAVPLHARTRSRMEDEGLLGRMESAKGVRVVEALGYLEFLGMLSKARLAVTDSGGVQAEAAVLGVPCITLRDTTEWTETIDAGVNRLLDPADVGQLPRLLKNAMTEGRSGEPLLPPFWDGRASERIIAAVTKWLKSAESAR